MYKSNTLFDMSKLVQRPIPEQREFEIAYYALLSKLPTLVEKAMEMMLTARSKKTKMAVNRNWSANEMNGNLIDLISREFPEFIKDTGRGNFELYLNHKYECYIKKIRGWQPQYNHSDTSRRIVNAVAEKNEDPIPVIFLGYKATKSMDAIKGIYAVCIKGKEKIWRSDLTAIEEPTKRSSESENANVTELPPLSVEAKPNRKSM